MNDYLDLYCERLHPGLWSEPLNAVSNASFFIAAWAIWKLARQHGKIPLGIRTLIILTTAIGLGSTLFHTFATRWSNLLDVIPIFLFQIWFLWLYSRKIIGINRGYAGILVLGFSLVSSFSKQFKFILNGSFAYGPALVVLLGLGLYHHRQLKREKWILLAAAGVFFLSLIFRTVDQRACSLLSSGTHYLWHCLNGLLLYLSARGLIQNWKTAPILNSYCKVP